jgi:hypothetical protein
MLFFILDEDKNVIPTDMKTYVAWVALGYDKRRVGKDEVAGGILSTVYTLDGKFETLFMHPDGDEMERYSTWQDAAAGHDRWLRKLGGDDG